MRAAIWKYELTGPDAQQEIAMPNGTAVLSATVQRGRLFIWARVDLDAVTLTRRRFEVRATGEMFVINGQRFIGTAQKENLVWHVFEML